MSVQPIPEGYHAITPYLTLNNAAAAIEFYKKAFGAIEHVRLDAPNGKVGHAEIMIGDSLIMLADEFPEMGNKSATTLGESPVGLHLYVQDADKIFAQATAAGAKAKRPLENKFYGDRTGTVTDPFGYDWHVATHVEDVSMDEIRRRAAAMHDNDCQAAE